MRAQVAQHQAEANVRRDVAEQFLGRGRRAGGDSHEAGQAEQEETRFHGRRVLSGYDPGLPGVRSRTNRAKARRADPVTGSRPAVMPLPASLSGLAVGSSGAPRSIGGKSMSGMSQRVFTTASSTLRLVRSATAAPAFATDWRRDGIV